MHLAFFSGNEVFWKTRWESSIDGSGTPYRTLVCYKETHANAKIDPTSTWTGTWRDPRFTQPPNGGSPENALTGTIFGVNAPSAESITVPAAFGKHRFWRNTSVATLNSGQTAVFAPGTLGYEWDQSPYNGFQPQALMRLSSATVSVPSLLQDYGSTYGPGQATHSLSLYRHSGGALVFGAGTVQWAWGLDSVHDDGSAAADPRLQQAMVNLLADMGSSQQVYRPGLQLQRPPMTLQLRVQPFRPLRRRDLQVGIKCLLRVPRVFCLVTRLGEWKFQPMETRGTLRSVPQPVRQVGALPGLRRYPVP